MGKGQEACSEKEKSVSKGAEASNNMVPLGNGNNYSRLGLRVQMQIIQGIGLDSQSGAHHQ